MLWPNLTHESEDIKAHYIPHVHRRRSDGVRFCCPCSIPNLCDDSQNLVNVISGDHQYRGYCFYTADGLSIQGLVDNMSFICFPLLLTFLSFLPGQYWYNPSLPSVEPDESSQCDSHVLSIWVHNPKHHHAYQANASYYVGTWPLFLLLSLWWWMPCL